MEPSFPSALRKIKPYRSWIPWLGVLTLAAVLLVASFSLDDSVARLVNDHPDSRVRSAGRLISHYGDWSQHALFGAILWIIAYLRHSPRWRRIVLMMIVASTIGGLLADVLRGVTGRPRPSTQKPDGWYGPHIDYKYNAFPSGHTAASTAFFGAVLFVEWPVGVIVLIIPIAVGWARIYVGAHHFSDIVASAIIGAVSAYVAWRLVYRRHDQLSEYPGQGAKRLP
jgi:membrane-associated phospholipid phosphatase